MSNALSWFVYLPHLSITVGTNQNEDISAFKPIFTVTLSDGKDPTIANIMEAITDQDRRARLQKLEERVSNPRDILNADCLLVSKH